MTYDEILQLLAETVGEKLTEKELDALAQAITCAEHGLIQAVGAGAILSWMITAERIPEGVGEALADIVRIQWKQNKEDESDESVRAN